MGNTCKIFVAKAEVRRLLGKPRQKQYYNIKMNLN
jgi:hypothetical protein